MHSYKSFTPGTKGNSINCINYIAIYNAIYPNSPKKSQCVQNANSYDKNNITSNARIPKKIRLSQLINNTKGGKSQYGNFYLGNPLNINYLGRMEGMSGGSGSPLVNNF